MSRAALGAQAIACVVAGALSACASTSPIASQAADFHPVSGWRVATDALSLRMRAIGTDMERLGLVPEREAFSGFLTAGARGTHPIELAPHTCVTLLALASEGIADMDAAIYNPEGDVLAVDSQPDAHPSLQICGGAEPVRLYYTLQIYEGAGTFLMTGFTGSRASLEAAAKQLGARPVVADLGEAAAAGPGRVSAFRDGVQRRGFQLIQSPVRVPLVSAQRIRAVLAVEPGACYTAAGFALDGLKSVDLRVLDEEGVEIARDGSEEEDASAQFCAERGAEYAAELQGISGEGSALLLLFRADAAQIGGRAGLWLGERPLARAATASLDSALAAVTRRAAEDGFKHARRLPGGQLAPGAVVSQRVVLPAHRCARVHAVGGPGIRRLQLVAVDAHAQTLARGEGEAETTYLHVCTSAARELSLQAYAAAGTGPFAFSVYEAPLSELMPQGGDEGLAADLQQALRQARDLGYRPLPDFQDPQRVRLQQSEPVSIKLEPEPLRCVRAYVLSRGKARGELMLAGKQVDSAPQRSAEPARFCTGKEAAAEVDSLELRLSTSGAHDEAWVMVLAR